MTKDRPMNPMETLAEKIAMELDLGRWLDTEITREIATSEDKAEAVARIEQMLCDCEAALRMLGKPHRAEVLRCRECGCENLICLKCDNQVQ